MPTSDLITTLRTGAQGLDSTIRFLILDVCDRLERKTRDNELLAQKIVELRLRSHKTNADRIRAMSDEELYDLLKEAYNAGCDDATAYEWGSTKYSFEWTEEWLKQPVEDE